MLRAESVINPTGRSKVEIFWDAPPEERHDLFATEAREGDANEEVPRPMTVEEVAKVAAIF